MAKPKKKSETIYKTKYSEILDIKSDNAAFRHIYRLYFFNAKARNLIFNIPETDFKSLIANPCYYCGIPPYKSYSTNYESVVYNGLDRMDSQLGYTIDNVVSCCNQCNMAKRTQSVESFRNWIKRIVTSGFLEK